MHTPVAAFEQETINFIHANNLIGIKAGSQRNTFLQIWMVVLDNRVFARSWGLHERSWFNTFLQEPIGQIQCGDKVTNIRARIAERNEYLQERINQAYLDKYNKGDNAFYAQGIIKPAHVARTMELLPLDSSLNKEHYLF